MRCLTLSGKIVHGRNKGTPSGFPTANLDCVEAAVLPPSGVYASRVLLNGGVYAGVTNIGTRPTADPSGVKTVETWILDFSEDVYGQEMTLELKGFIRGIRHFPDMRALKAQIDRDAALAREMARQDSAVCALSSSQEETEALGRALSAILQPGDVIALQGDLGAGKSVFARGVARGLGITAPVPSPTFVILNAYDNGRLPLYHFDWYRIEDEEELAEMGVTDQLYGSGACIIEWPCKGESYLPKRRLSVSIKRIDDQNRLLTFQPCGGFAPLRAEQMKEKVC